MYRVKLQLSYARSHNHRPSRVVIRILSTDVAEVCVDDVDGSCWMRLLRAEWMCYETLGYILGHLGLSARGHLGSKRAFWKRANRPFLLAWGMSPQTILGVCDAGRSRGWPCLIDGPNLGPNLGHESIKVYFSDFRKSGTSIYAENLRRLDHLCHPVVAIQAVNLYVMATSVWDSTCLDIHGLPSFIGPAFLSQPPPPPPRHTPPPPPPHPPHGPCLDQLTTPT